MAASSIGFDDEARRRKKERDELEAMPRPSQETKLRFPEDIALRAAGFRIHERPAKGEPVWERNGILFPHSEAVLRLKPASPA